MKSTTLALKNILHRPLGPLLTLLLIALSVAIVLFSQKLQKSIETRFTDNLAGIDLILSAKGSPLQSVLCNLFHLDNPTGNISISDAKPHLNPNHPLIQTAIPVSLGDNYQGYRIMGTTADFFEQYGLALSEGQMLTENNEVVLGYRVAEKLNLDLGDEFLSSHGIVDQGIDHTHANPLRVVGIFDEKNNITDHLIYTLPSTIWAQHHAQDATAVVRTKEELLLHPNQEITSLLIVFKGRSMQVLNFARNINTHTKIMAADPAIELNRLYLWLGSGVEISRLLAMAILIIAMLSIFITQWMTLKNRISDMAVIRLLGGSQRTVLFIFCIEALIVALLGILAGLILFEIGGLLTNSWMNEKFQIQIALTDFGIFELQLASIIMIISLLAIIIPAYRLYRSSLANALQTST